MTPKNSGAATPAMVNGMLLMRIGLANGGRISGESVAPVVVTENRHLRRARDVIAIGNQAARSRNDSEAAEEVAGDEFDGAEFGLPMDDQVELPGVLVREQGREDIVVIAKKFVGGPREIRARGSRLPVRRNLLPL